MLLLILKRSHSNETTMKQQYENFSGLTDHLFKHIEN